MESPFSGTLMSPATRQGLKVVIYYAVLLSVGWLMVNQLPTSPGLMGVGLDPILSTGGAPSKKDVISATIPTDETGRSAAVAAAMTAAILLSLPVAWVYQLTR